MHIDVTLVSAPESNTDRSLLVCCARCATCTSAAASVRAPPANVFSRSDSTSCAERSTSNSSSYVWRNVATVIHCCMRLDEPCPARAYARSRRRRQCASSARASARARGTRPSAATRIAARTRQLHMELEASDVAALRTVPVMTNASVLRCACCTPRALPLTPLSSLIDERVVPSDSVSVRCALKKFLRVGRLTD